VNSFYQKINNSGKICDLPKINFNQKNIIFTFIWYYESNNQRSINFFRCFCWYEKTQKCILLLPSWYLCNEKFQYFCVL